MSASKISTKPIGLISDTHGLLRPEAIAALDGSAQIIHAGDIGGPEILDRLSAIAPVTAVRGNVDTMELPETALIEAPPFRILVIHDVKQLTGAGFDIVISGHSHKPGESIRGSVRYINPGSAGPRRFKLPITVARLHLAPLRVEFVNL
jgi:putative phosphoesterase